VIASQRQLFLNLLASYEGDVSGDPVEISRQTSGDVSKAATKSELSEPGRPADPPETNEH